MDDQKKFSLPGFLTRVALSSIGARISIAALAWAWNKSTTVETHSVKPFRQVALAGAGVLAVGLLIMSLRHRHELSYEGLVDKFH